MPMVELRHLRLVAISTSTLAAALLAREAEAATPTYYNSLASFTNDIQSSVTDDYSNPGYVFIQNNAAMNAVLGETDYETTGFDNLNIVSGGYYCAGCNGSFRLSFTTTSVGTAAGVNGVGVDIPVNSPMLPYYAYITFADGTTEDVQLPGAGSFWGVSAPERIESIHFGLSMGGATQNGSFGIDNLIIGDGMDTTPCGDGIATPDEECDDAGESATCDANCTLAQCGDGTLNPTAGEICDEGPASPTCNADCTVPSCGDGILNMLAGEQCDDAGESATCNVDCTLSMCGDGVENPTAGEECDDSAQSPACDADCTFAVCGDGVENNTAGEFCDDGNNLDGDGCSATCTNEEPPATTSDTGGSSGGSSDGGSTDGGSSGGATSNAESSSGGAVDSGGSEGGTAADTTGGSGGASDSATTAATFGTGESSSGGGSGGGSDSGGQSNQETGGCACTTEPGRGAPTAWLALVGLLGLRRHRDAAAGPPAHRRSTRSDPSSAPRPRAAARVR